MGRLFNLNFNYTEFGTIKNMDFKGIEFDSFKNAERKCYGKDHCTKD